MAELVESNWVGLSFIIFGECVSSSEGSERFHTLHIICGAPDFWKKQGFFLNQTHTIRFYLKCFAFRHPFQESLGLWEAQQAQGWVSSTCLQGWHSRREGACLWNVCTFWAGLAQKTLFNSNSISSHNKVLVFCFVFFLRDREWGLFLSVFRVMSYLGLRYGKLRCGEFCTRNPFVLCRLWCQKHPQLCL